MRNEPKAPRGKEGKMNGRNKHSPGCPATITGPNWRYKTKEVKQGEYVHCAICWAVLRKEGGGK